MAKTEIVTSDIDGASPASTVSVVLGGRDFEIDLTPAQTADFDEVIGRYAAYVEVDRFKRRRTPKAPAQNTTV